MKTYFKMFFVFCLATQLYAMEDPTKRELYSRASALERQINGLSYDVRYTLNLSNLDTFSERFEQLNTNYLLLKSELNPQFDTKLIHSLSKVKENMDKTKDPLNKFIERAVEAAKKVINFKELEKEIEELRIKVQGYKEKERLEGQCISEIDREIQSLKKSLLQMSDSLAQHCSATIKEIVLHDVQAFHYELDSMLRSLKNN